MTAMDDSTESLTSALAKARVPAANHDFIRRFASAIGIARYEAMAVDTTKPYVLATRHDGLPPLHIHYGFTSGFATEEEVVRAAGNDVTRAPSSRKGTWYVAHPVNEIRPRGERAKDVRREARFCSCGMQLSLTGNCDYCS
ncbi:hypothetical protein MN2019_21235 [Mycolicibacterium neoaurum]|uniref:hypothetical protein n=1 Tax=Mycolicibacterium neoaurum TaxID=1795 RepID=UPI001BCDF4E8|nr:hypothetical protein [Mycolicibacterium neoaurum]QVI26768.1 hypothetical protein MN2019_21235 [Mycolicibacterium neoaurum]